MTPGSKPRSTTPNINNAAVGPPPPSKPPHAAAGQYPPYPPIGAVRPEHLGAYNNVAAAYGRPILGYDSHPHTRTAGITTNGMGTMSGGKP